MTRILLYIASVVASVFGIRSGLLDPAFDWVKDFVTQQVPAFIWPMLPDGLASFFADFDVSQTATLVQQATWFIPFWPIISIYFVALGLAAAVLFVRYVIGWIPTIEG